MNDLHWQTLAALRGAELDLREIRNKLDDIDTSEGDDGMTQREICNLIDGRLNSLTSIIGKLEAQPGDTKE